VEPEALNAAIILEEQMPPVEGYINSELSIDGTARIIAGPLSPIEFQGYSVRYSENFQNPVWMETDGLHPNQVADDTLALWNTSGLEAKQYALLLTLFHSLGDSLPLPSTARLQEGTSGLSDDKNIYQLSFELNQNYPNPFNPSTKISWQSAASGWQTLKIFDVLGNEVATLVDEYKLAGNYEIEFDASSAIRNLVSGIYYYQLKAGSFIQTKKMVFLK
ncbi:MAG: T9SS type A sorting domain-containing protein, partial [Ignavibacteriaceae bacterium]